ITTMSSETSPIAAFPANERHRILGRLTAFLHRQTPADQPVASSMSGPTSEHTSDLMSPPPLTSRPSVLDTPDQLTLDQRGATHHKIATALVRDIGAEVRARRTGLSQRGIGLEEAKGGYVDALVARINGGDRLVDLEPT